MIMKVQRAESHRPSSSLQQEATPPPVASLPPAPQVQPAGGGEVYWGDRVALKVWLFCFLVMGMMNILDFIAGMWGR